MVKTSLGALLFFNLFCSVLWAQSEGLSSSQTLLQRLPEPNGNFQTSLVVNSYNLSTYQSLIIPELMPRLRSDSLQMNVFSRLSSDINLGSIYKLEPEDPVLIENGGLETALGSIDAPLFSLSKSSPISELGAKLLWNVHSSWWASRYLDSEISLHFVRNDTLFRTYKGQYSRIYPRSLYEEDSTEQLYRSTLRFNDPVIISGYSWLRFRFQSEDRDVLFMYSPVVKKVRQLTSSNATDSLLGSSLTMDDMLVWSGRVGEVEVTEVSTDTYLAPVVDFSGGLVRYQKAGGCEIYSVQQNKHLWNYQSKQIIPGASWLPTSAVYIPRVMERVTLIPSDPYSAYGRQVLYVDAESYLPVYKVVYDKSGVLWKIVMGVYGYGGSEGSRRGFSLVQQIVLDEKNKQVSLVEFNTFKSCEKLDKEVLNSFSPNGLKPDTP